MNTIHCKHLWVAVLSGLLAPTAFAAEQFQDPYGFSYTVTDETARTCQLISKPATPLPSIVVMEDEVNGYTVTSIASSSVLKNIMGCEELSLPRHISVLPDQALGNSSIPDGQASVLRKVVLPSDLKVLSNSLLQQQLKLEEVVIPEGAESIIYACFYNCSNLKNLVFPGTLTSLDSQIFYDMGTAMVEGDNTITLHFNSSVPPTIKNNTFDRIGGTTKCPVDIIVPFGAVEAYSNAQYWNNLDKSRFTIKEFVPVTASFTQSQFASTPQSAWLELPVRFSYADGFDDLSQISGLVSFESSDESVVKCGFDWEDMENPLRVMPISPGTTTLSLALGAGAALEFTFDVYEVKADLPVRMYLKAGESLPLRMTVDRPAGSSYTIGDIETPEGITAAPDDSGDILVEGIDTGASGELTATLTVNVPYGLTPISIPVECHVEVLSNEGSSAEFVTLPLQTEGGVVAAHLVGDSVQLTPDDGYEFHTATYGGEVLDDEAHYLGTLTLPDVADGKKLQVVFKHYLATEAKMHARNLKVTVSGDQINIDGKYADSEVIIRSADGKVLISTNQSTINAGSNGVFLLTVEGETFKLLL